MGEAWLVIDLKSSVCFVGLIYCRFDFIDFKADFKFDNFSWKSDDLDL